MVSHSVRLDKQALAQELSRYPEDWRYTPVNGKKAPYLDKWQQQPLTAAQMQSHLKESRCRGLGVLCGQGSGGYLFLDRDGESCQGLIEKLSEGRGLPPTVAVTSGRKGRSQAIYWIPKQYWSAIATKKLKTGVKGADGKPEQLEFRWDGCQSVVAGAHPTTGRYRWLPGQAPWECEIAEAPVWAIEQMLRDKPHPVTSSSLPLFSASSSSTSKPNWSDRDWALSYLEALSLYRAEDYDDWIAVGMALHSVEDSLLDDWERWSSQSSKYKPGECAKKWKSFKREGIKIGTLGQMAKQDGWTNPLKKKTAVTTKAVSSSPRFPAAPPAATTTETLSSEQLKSRLQHLLDIHASSSVLAAKIPLLARQSGLSSGDVWRLYSALQREDEQAEVRLSCKQEIARLLQLEGKELNLEHYLHLYLAKPLNAISQLLGLNPATMLTTLLPVAASLLPVGTRLELLRATHFYALPILYSGIVAESGSGKSPAQKTLLRPLFKMQAAADEGYNWQQQEWREQCRQAKENKDELPPAPLPHEYYVTDATSEATALIQSQQPNRGFLLYQDELSSVVKSCNAYRGGRGTDSEKLLSGRDGTGLKINRASGKRISLAQSGYSITGSIQPDTLKKQMGDMSDPSGHWARFIWCVLPVKPAYFPKTDTIINIDDVLLSTYRNLEQLEPRTYRLSAEAREVYRLWFDELEDLRVRESRQGLRAVYAKMKATTGEIALLLHCLNAAVVGQQPEEQVNQATLKQAVALAKFYLGQIQLIYAEGDAAEGELSPIYTKIIQLSERKGWIRAKDVRENIRLFKNQKVSPDAIRSHFRELEALGIGVTKGMGARLQWIYQPQRATDLTPPSSCPPQSSTSSVSPPLEPVAPNESTSQTTQPINSAATETSSESAASDNKAITQRTNPQERTEEGQKEDKPASESFKPGEGFAASEVANEDKTTQKVNQSGESLEAKQQPDCSSSERAIPPFPSVGDKVLRWRDRAICTVVKMIGLDARTDNGFNISRFAWERGDFRPLPN